MATAPHNEHTQKQVDTLHELGQTLGGAGDLEGALQDIFKILDDRLEMNLGTLSLLDLEEGSVEIDIAYGLSPSEIERGRYKIGEGITGKVVEAGKPVIVPRISSEPMFLDRTGARKRAAASNRGTKRSREDQKSQTSFICVPIIVQKAIVGALSVDTPYETDVLLQENVRFLSVVAAMIGQAVAARNTARREKTRLLDENMRLHTQLRERFHPANIIGNSRAMQELSDMVGKVAQSDATVLLRGESGTGKELVADALHFNSLRASKPLVKIHVAALPESLIESELFGHEKGAFTGADAGRAGRFERAQGGTIFLDEIGELDPSIQVKLLRVLQAREVERLGGSEPLPVDVRVVAATHVDLEQAVAKGTFREDLFYRLNIFPIFMPPLRERKSDILQLADHFLEKYARQHNKEMKRISTPAIDMMMSYHWPGNVRELENCVERAVILNTDGVVHGHHLPPSLQTADATGTPIAGSFDVMISSYEREILVEALKNARGNVTKAARVLGTTTRILAYRAGKLGIEPREFKR